jgi:hypothetical protein
MQRETFGERRDAGGPLESAPGGFVPQEERAAILDGVLGAVTAALSTYEGLPTDEAIAAIVESLLNAALRRTLQEGGPGGVVTGPA